MPGKVARANLAIDAARFGDYVRHGITTAPIPHPRDLLRLIRDATTLPRSFMSRMRMRLILEPPGARCRGLGFGIASAVKVARAGC
ncbi:hypothetical protein BE17_28990 [Sorangium cellulosum]|uniref:Uncharacterized protein n=1 Tax=Sorangium cellulosum TaxID=56 RepID=A0A150R6N3_SORCE|nr:hypothetical protein BE17_28990 [Sorangium cellulosum]